MNVQTAIINLSTKDISIFSTIARAAVLEWTERTAVKMAYLVPAELPKSCCTCPFGICKFSHPFFAREKPNRKGYVCAFDKTNKVIETHIDDFNTRAEWCPLKEVKIIEAVVKDEKDGGENG